MIKLSNRLTALSISAIILLVATATSCNRIIRHKAPSTEFATFIKAYTGGVISDKSTIKVQLTSQLAQVQLNTAINEKYFTFSPSIKGTTKWTSPTTLEFVPDPGALKPGRTYKGILRLDKLMKISDRKLKHFPFSFMISRKEAAFAINEVVIPESDPAIANVNGEIFLSESLDIDAVKSMIEFNYPSDSATLEISAGNNGDNFKFAINGLIRDKVERKLSVNLKPGDSGFNAKSSTEVAIPAKGHFAVLSADLIESKDPHIRIQFTEPLNQDTDKTGLITIDNVTDYRLQVNDNIVNVYYNGRDNNPLILNISQGLKSYEGTSLEGDFVASFSPEELKPSVSIPFSGNILPDAKMLILPFQAVNLKAVDLSIIKIYENNVLMFLQDGQESYNIRRAGRLIYKRCIRLDSDPTKDLHKWQDFAVDLSGLFKQEPGALYRIRLSFKQDYSLYGKNNGLGTRSASEELIDISSGDMTDEDIATWDIPEAYYYDSIDWSQYKWKDRDNPLTPSYYLERYRDCECTLMTSNIGLTAKYAGNDILWVSASDIITGKPIYGVDFEVFNFQLQKIGSGKADSEGFEEIKLKGKPFVVVARKNNSTSYLTVTEGTENSLSRFDVGGRKLEKGLKAYIYGERGVWRPGDTLHLCMILADKINPVPDSHPAVMELYTPQGQFYTKQICGNAINGFYTYTIPTQSEDPTGVWNAYFKVGGATFHKSLNIESIKPNRLKVNINIKEKVLKGEQQAHIGISSNWLTGSIASGLKTKAEMHLSSGGTYFKGFEGYYFTDPSREFGGIDVTLVDSRLDQNGEYGKNVKMPSADGAPGMLNANIVCSVEEPGGDASYSTLSIPFSPYSGYVGIKLPKHEDDKYIETDTDTYFPVTVVDCNGKRIAGHQIEYRIYKMQWTWWWESKASEIDSYVNGTGAEMIASGNMTSGNTDMKIPFRINYPEWGRYLIYVKDMSSGHASGGMVYVDWPAYRGRSDKKDPTSLTMLTFSTDKKSYEIGETATVYIPGTEKGKALVSLENSTKVISREWVSTTGNNETAYSFKITPEMAPNFYVHITLIQPHKHNGNDLPIRMYGAQRVLVSNKESRLEPIISMPETIHPEEEFSIKVKEKTGKPMTYTLAIVDEGLLDLTAFRTPDPWNEMYAPEALGVKTWDLYDKIIGAYTGQYPPMLSIGGDLQIRLGSRKDNRFNPVVKFIGPFTLKKGGTETHRIKLPMYVGSVRVMLVAGGGKAYGNAEKTVPVISPLMILPTLPRTIGTGEEVVLPVNVFAMEKGIHNVNMTVSTEGALKVNGNGKSEITFDNPGDKLVRFGLKTNGEGPAKVTISASAGSYKVKETISIDVRNSNPPVTEVHTAAINAGESQTLHYTPFKSDGTQTACLEIKGFPSINFNAIFDFVKNYEYNCTEQISSRGISLLYSMESLSEGKSAEAKKLIPELLQSLYSRQLADGGFAYWPGNSSADEWASSMAGHFMTEAANQGYDVNKGVLANWKKFQERSSRNFRLSESKYLNDLTQAYRLYTLASAGSPDNGAMNRLKESQNLSEQARWMLASAYALCGKKQISEGLIQGLGNEPEYRASNITYGTPLRDKAIILESLVLTDKMDEALTLASEVASTFSESRNSSQETAFVCVAMGRIAGRSVAKDIDIEIAQGTKVTKANGEDTSKPIDITSEEGEVTVKNDSDGSIYATIVTVHTSDSHKIDAASSGLRISVSYLSENGTPVYPFSIRQGSEFTAVIKVTSTDLSADRRNIALTQMIPSGWEITNDRLLGNNAIVSSRDSYTYHDIRDDRNVWYFDLDRGMSKTFKTRLRASYEGRFILPSVKCEAMYEPEVFACTASGNAEVTR